MAVSVTHATVASDPQTPLLDHTDWNALHLVSGTKADWDAACSDGDFMFAGDPPTSHTHTISEITSLQTTLDGKNIYLADAHLMSWQPAGAGSSTITAIGAAALTATGTATAAARATTSKYTARSRLDYLVTVAATTAVAGFRYNVANTVLRGNQSWLGGFYLDVEFGISTGTSNATRRMFAGLRGSSAAPTDVNPSTLTNIIGVGYDAADTNLKLMYNDGAGTATKVDLGSNFPIPSADNTSSYRLIIWCNPNASDVNWSLTNIDTGAVTSGTINTDIPAATQYLTLNCYTSVGGTSAVTGISLFKCNLWSINQ